MRREDLVTVAPSDGPAGLHGHHRVGDIGEHEALELLGAALADWVQEGTAARTRPAPCVGRLEVVETRRRRQTAQVIGFPTPGLLTPERWRSI